MNFQRLTVKVLCSGDLDWCKQHLRQVWIFYNYSFVIAQFVFCEASRSFDLWTLTSWPSNVIANQRATGTSTDQIWH